MRPSSGPGAQRRAAPARALPVHRWHRSTALVAARGAQEGPASIADMVDRALSSDGDPLRFRHLALEALGRIAPFDSAIFVALDPGRAILAPPATVNKEQYQALFRRVHGDQGRYRSAFDRGHAAARRQQGAFLDNEVFTSGERDRLPFFDEVVRPQGITSQLTGHVGFRDRPSGVFYLCRHGRGRAFHARELEGVRQLLPTLGLAHAALATPARGAHGSLDVPAGFRLAVKSALRHLHEAGALAASPLLATELVRRHAGAEAGAHRRVLALQELLREGIAALGSTARTLPMARALDRTYVRPAASQILAADELVMSFGSYRRHLTAGLDELVSALWLREHALADS